VFFRRNASSVGTASSPHEDRPRTAIGAGCEVHTRKSISSVRLSRDSREIGLVVASERRQEDSRDLIPSLFQRGPTYQRGIE
jgi:hypothetical protein